MANPNPLLLRRAGPGLSPAEETAFTHEIRREFDRCDTEEGGGLLNYLDHHNTNPRARELDGEDFQRMILGLFSEASPSEVAFLFQRLSPAGQQQQQAIPFDDILVRECVWLCVTVCACFKQVCEPGAQW